MKPLLLLLSCLKIFLLQAQVPKPSAGRIHRMDSFPSAFVAPRNIDVWLPHGYTPKKKYAVLYMHDGQMLFDSTATWNRQEWGVDETASRLLKEGSLKDLIVVGIWNNGKFRHAEYFPQKPLMLLPSANRDTLIAQELKGKPLADNYLRFLVEELKPFIDSAFSTKKDRINTFIAGSSMGGLISLYAICEYSKVFGAAACISTHWPGSIRQPQGLIPSAFLSYLQQHLPDKRNHRIYFDYGTATLDSLYKPYQLDVDRLMHKKGYSRRNWITCEFAGEDHTEKAWSRRLQIPLLFLAGTRRS
jgi:predicted alpha/beta superfamily hydrolase